MSAPEVVPVAGDLHLPALDRRHDRWPMLPGIVLAITISGCAFSARAIPGAAIFSPMILGVVLGMLFGNVVGTSDRTRLGVVFCQKSLLRFAIVLLGFQVTGGQLASIGVMGMAIVTATLAATYAATLLLGRLLRVDAGLTHLIAAGTSVCGASAIVAANAVTKGREEDVAYAISAITLFGTIAMLGLPVIGTALALAPSRFGLWAGASIHEVAQVVGAGFQYGTQAGEVAVIAKLCRVVLLAPLLLVIATMRSGEEKSSAGVAIPGFVMAFLLVVILNSVIEIPAEVRGAAKASMTFLMTVGLAALGLQADVSKIRSQGLRPLTLALASTLIVGGLSLALVMIGT